VERGQALPLAPRLPTLAAHDGELLWRDGLVTGPWLDEQQQPARPYSNARLLWHDDALLVALYAADEDIRTSGPNADTFELRAQVEGAPARELRLPVAGPVLLASETTAEAVPVQTSVDLDGTPDAGGGEGDEEWQVFAAVPWSLLGLRPMRGASFSLDLRRCDVPRDSVRRCGRWQGRVVLSGR
jgi:hypothetical protein